MFRNRLGLTFELEFYLGLKQRLDFRLERRLTLGLEFLLRDVDIGKLERIDLLLE